MADAFVEAWAASASDKARIEAFAGWLKARRPLDRRHPSRSRDRRAA